MSTAPSPRGFNKSTSKLPKSTVKTLMKDNKENDASLKETSVSNKSLLQ
jgi:hypothetical protein